MTHDVRYYFFSNFQQKAMSILSTWKTYRLKSGKTGITE